MEPIKLTEPHSMFCGTLGFRETPFEEHCFYRQFAHLEALFWKRG